MRVLLSTIGSRGDVQPLVALAEQLRALGQAVRLCVPPDFQTWIEGLGFPVTPIGAELRQTASSTVALPTPEQWQQLAEATVAAQFETLSVAARGCDAIVAATALQIAARSVAERQGIPYVFAAYGPVVLPSPHHAPPAHHAPGQTPTAAAEDNAALWAQNADSFNARFRDALNRQRAAIGLAPVAEVSRHIFTDCPWLAADPVLAPWPEPDDAAVFQPGAWILPDKRPLSGELEAFLAAGEPPVYCGFGSNRAPQDASRMMVQAARALDKRVILARGWADLVPVDDAPDCLAIDEVNQQALFKRVAAVLHHGGAGTTTAAALAGAPQVIVPRMYDQYYFAQRVDQLGVGAAHAPGTPGVDSLASVLEQALQPDVTARARFLSARVRADGARVAAEQVMTLGVGAPRSA